MVGFVGLLLTLVLGLLVGAAFGTFTKQQSEAYSLVPLAIEIDRAHQDFGTEGAVGRAHLRAAVKQTRARFFGGDGRGPRPFTHEEMRAVFAAQDNYFEELEPATEKQRRSLKKAWDLARKYQDTQMLMANQLANPFPPYVLNIVVYWACALFLGNGLLTTPNAITMVAFIAGATSVAMRSSSYWSSAILTPGPFGFRPQASTAYWANSKMGRRKPRSRNA